MTDIAITPQIEEIRILIESSRRHLADGHLVDISEVEQKVQQLYDTIEKNPEIPTDTTTDQIAALLSSLMSELDRLEVDLTQQNDRLNAEDKIPPGSAAAAYRS